MVKIKIDRKSREVSYDWLKIKQLQDRLGSNFEEAIGSACLNMDMDVLAEALSIGTGLEKIEIIAESPPIVESSDAITRALNYAFHGAEEPKESLRESLARKLKTLFYRLKKQRIATA